MPTDAERIQVVFLAAAKIDGPQDRAEYLDGACAGDAELRARVEALLRAHGQPDSLLDQPAVAAGTPNTPTAGYDGNPAADDEIPLGFLSPATRPDSLGRIGHYEVLQVLGRGGFGIVFRAFDDVLHRVVAVKVLAPQMAATSPARKRFLREARSSARVRHENVVQVYEVGEQPLPYIAMEFIPGENLQLRLDRTGPVGPAEVVRVGRQVAEGLAAAHATDLIHRDIKPGNVLLEGGHLRVKITDFGLARAADDASLSHSGVIAGTPLYMAPEQAQGQPLDQRADLFSLGSVLYQMATGRPPFRAATTLAVMKRVAEDAPRPIREVIPETPQWLCDVIAKLHAKNPADRYQSAREVADVLADCEAQLAAHGRVKDFSRIPSGKPAAAGRRGRRRWVPAAAVMLGFVGWVAGTIVREEWKHADRTPTPIDFKLAANPSPKPAADGWAQLFNGRDLSGWLRSPKPAGEWTVRDGVIQARTSFRDYLFTERGNYRNFHLRVEAKINRGGDGGLLFRCEHGLGSKFGTVRGYESEVNDTPKAPRGTLWTGPEGPNNSVPAKPGPDRSDKWFVQEVIATDGRIVVKLDGEIVLNHLDDPEHYTRGHIALQVWGETTELSVRKVEVMELPSPPAPDAATNAPDRRAAESVVPAPPD